MRFEARDLKPYAVPVVASELREGWTYFSVGFLDGREMKIPSLEPIVFIGRDLNAEDSGLQYFQDAGSYLRGVRYDSATRESEATFYLQPEDQLGFIFEYEEALELLLACSLRRRSLA